MWNGGYGLDVRAPESKTSASYTSSTHLSRVLSPVWSILMPSLFAERFSLALDPLAGPVGVMGVDELTVEDVAAFLVAFAGR